MGGNVTAINKKTGLSVRADIIDLRKIGRETFSETFKGVFREINLRFEDFYGVPIWSSYGSIESGFVFNGSTSFIMDASFPTGDIIRFKPLVGDVDITVPDDLREMIWEFLDSIEGIEILPGVVYHGSNKPTFASVGEQINSIFQVNFSGMVLNCQVDFEFAPFEDGLPNEWAKFSHGSSFSDVKMGIKAVHHKYLIRAMVGARSRRDDVIIATGKSTPGAVKISKSQRNSTPRMLKFSVSRGLRVAYSQMFNPDGTEIFLDGKKVFREILSKISTYETKLEKIFHMLFPGDVLFDKEKFESFQGIIEMIRMYFTPEQIQDTHQRYRDLLWGNEAQQLVAGDPEADNEIKLAGYNKFTELL